LEENVPLVVTGISEGSDISALEKALRDAGHSLEPLSVYLAGDLPEGHPDSGARFVVGNTDSIRDMLSGSSGIYSMGGGTVPGMQADISVTASDYFHDETLEDELSELSIPDSELDNYEEAIEAGHGVIAYFARPENQAVIEGIFRDAGLRNVRTF
jgi:hypothetical protein